MPLQSSKYFTHVTGGVIYMGGDTIAALIAGEFNLWRSLGIFVIGATVYAFEINRYFAWIEQKVNRLQGIKRVLLKTCLALIYFNPLWIARHLCFVYLVSGKGALISWSLTESALYAFIANVPVSILANYLIQNRTPLKYRFWASAMFSGLMAVYYSMSSVWF